MSVVQSIDEARSRAAGRVPPHNLEAEESLLGAMLLSRDAIVDAIEAHVDASDFYKPAHGHIYETVVDLYGQGEPVDPITLAEELRRKNLLDALGGKPTLLRLQAATPASSNASQYAGIVGELALLRRLIAVAGEISEEAYSAPEDVTQTLDRAEMLVFEVAERRVSETMVKVTDSLHATLDQLEQLYGAGETITGVRTGYTDLDQLLLGLQPSNLVVVAARPGMGKTAWALGAASHVAIAEQKPVLFFSMEMGHLELTKRLLAAEARVDLRRLQTGNIPENEWPLIHHAVGRLAAAPLFIDDNPRCTVMEMRAKARRTKAREGDLGMVVVDYLQLMSSPHRSENRQVEVSDFSRGLKILARELDCPVVALSQLNRQLEYRADKRPMLADLRETGCLTGDSFITRADTGGDVSLLELFESDARDVPVWTLDERFKLRRSVMTHVFASGVKQVFELRLASGRCVKASANHPFLAFEGWRRLDQLEPGTAIAVPRAIASGEQPGDLSDAQIVLLGHLIGDGCHLQGHALQYTTTDPANVEVVAQAAREAFGIEARVHRERTWIQVSLPAPYHLTHDRGNPIGAWLDDLGLWGCRSWEKRIPPEIVASDSRQIALFLRHLWATDGSVRSSSATGAVRLYCATTSHALALGVQSLLLRLGICARVPSVVQRRGRLGFTVDVSGRDDQLRFFDLVGIHGERGERIPPLRARLVVKRPKPNVDSVPREVWDHVRDKTMPELGITTRELARRLEMQYCGSTLYERGVGRARMRRLAEALPDPFLRDLADSDVLWDRVKEIVALGEEPVFDAEVPGTHNFVANNIVVHNSIEQDADVVMFVYRDEVYNPESEQQGMAEIIVAKHRNGPTGSERLAFFGSRTKFENMARD